MRRASFLVLFIAAFGLLGVQQCVPVDPPKDPFGIVKRVKNLESMVGDTKRAICVLYAKTGNAHMLPGFCPEPPGACDQPIQPGPCRAFLPRFGFDSDTGQCERFIYGGCQGNDNNFDTLAECERACEEPPVVCEEPIDPGPCDAFIPRWGFDSRADQCRRFVYGGCQGNDNNFQTLAECEDTCPGDPVRVCQLPPDRGPCRALIPRWHHDADSGTCKQFNWGGCGGNANNFQTLAECERACVGDGVCSLPAERGPCEALIPRWHHDADSGRCERFIWGGCGGNDNNFATLAECERACPLCSDDLCDEHEECRLHREPNCQTDRAGACVEPFCADVCDEGACPRGTVCELVDVQCVRAPCPPVRECKPLSPCERIDCQDWQVCEVFPDTGTPFCRDTCDGFPCAQGEICELQDVVCVREPCPPIATCVELPIAIP